MPTITVTSTLASGLTTIAADTFINVTAGNAVYGPSAATPTLTNAGTLSGGGAGKYGVVLAGSGSISNAGSITGTNAIGLDAGGQITNAAGGQVTGATSGIVDFGAATIANSGAIVGLSGHGISMATGTITNATGGMILGYANAIYSRGLGTVYNTGIIASSTLSGHSGIYLLVGGVVNNAAGGLITAYTAVYEKLFPGTVYNAGSIGGGAGLYSDGVYFAHGGTITNFAGGTITGFDAIYTNGSPVTVDNQGVLGPDRSYGVYLSHGGVLNNAAGASITATFRGVYVRGGPAAVTNAGSIAATGAGNTAVLFAAGFKDTLSVLPGAAFTGIVNGGNAVGASTPSTLVLAAGSSAGATGTLAGFGGQIVNFGSIDFTAAAPWLISGGTAGLAAGQVFAGFAPGDTIDLVGVSETISGFASGTLALGGAANLNLLFTGAFAPTAFSATPSADGTSLTVACFAAGTRLLSEAGEIAVERLRPGQRLVSVVHGALLPVVWTGWRRLRCTSHARPERVWPVRVRAHAFGPGRPHRDLLLSPDHALLLADAAGAPALVPVRLLVNGVSVAQEPRDSIEYWHVELARHGAVLAEGIAAESYLDTGNRADFGNGGAAVAAHPGFGGRMREQHGCAPLLLDGPAVAAWRARLRATAAALPAPAAPGVSPGIA